MMRRRRGAYLAALVVLAPVGLLTKLSSGPGAAWVAGYAGGFLYVVFWVFFALALAPHLPAGRVCLYVVAATSALEVLQLWNPEPLARVRGTFLGHALLGSRFAWSDFPYYAAGGLVAWGAVRLLDRPRGAAAR